MNNKVTKNMEKLEHNVVNCHQMPIRQFSLRNFITLVQVYCIAIKIVTV